jgi:hypothetical protein
MNNHLLPLQQHPRFATALATLGASTSAVPMPLSGDLQIVQQFGMRFASRGPVFAPQTEVVHRMAALRQSRLHLLNAEAPDPALRRAGFRQTHTGATVAELPLEGEILARLHPKWRATWRKSEDLTLSKAPFCPRGHGWLLEAERAQQRSAGYRALPHALVAAYAATGRDAAVVYTARQAGSPVAAMLFLRHAPVVTYHLGWTSDVGRRHGAHHQILIAAAHDHAAKVYRRLDLGLVDTHNTPGLARFKIGTGAGIRQLGGTWVKVPGL